MNNTENNEFVKQLEASQQGLKDLDSLYTVYEMAAKEVLDSLISGINSSYEYAGTLSLSGAFRDEKPTYNLDDYRVDPQQDLLTLFRPVVNFKLFKNDRGQCEVANYTVSYDGTQSVVSLYSLEKEVILEVTGHIINLPEKPASDHMYLVRAHAQAVATGKFDFRRVQEPSWGA